MTIRNSVETARASVSNIESYISKKWPGFFDEIATTLSKPLWRMGKNDMFAICDQDIDDINKVQFLAKIVNKYIWQQQNLSPLLNLVHRR